jgi:hypothetical protein
VHESGGGTSSLSFDYRIVAKRRGYEAERLNDVTDRFNVEQAQFKRVTPANRTKPASRGEEEAQMVRHHPPASRLAKTGHPGHVEITKKPTRIQSRVKGSAEPRASHKTSRLDKLEPRT